MPAEIDATTLATRLADGLPTRLLDVRERWEFERVQIAGSINVPLGELHGYVGELPDDPDTLIVTICHHGVRSLRAATILEAAGHRAVRSLAGGVDRWAVTIDSTLARY